MRRNALIKKNLIHLLTNMGRIYFIHLMKKAFPTRFSDFVPYAHKVHAFIDGQFIPIPFCFIRINYPNYICKRISQKL